MSISYEGIGYLAVTMPADDCVAGQVCTVGDNGATACGSGDKFCGVVVAVEKGMAAVQVEGFVKLGYTGTAPSLGFASLTADGNGNVAVNSAGNSHLVVAVDTAGKTAVIKL